LYSGFSTHAADWVDKPTSRLYTELMVKEELTARLRSAIEDNPYRADIKSVALFGSHVHGTARDDSDIDVLIDFDPQAAIGLFEFIEIQDQLSEALGRKVDLLTPQALSKYFREEVLQEAEPVYEA
jgi:predicted nucleotidyltransferase